jgi:2'-5' RNA ligase
MRQFVALNLPAAERKRIFKASNPLRERELPVRWVDPDAFHVTLKFLGEVRQEASGAIRKVLQAVAAENGQFRLEMGGFGAFPTIRRPRIFWVGAEASPALRCLKQDVEWGLAELGFERETRAFHPHITLGRVNQDEGAGVFRGIDDLAASLTYTNSVAIKSVDLMRSELTKDGARYTVLESHTLRS